MKNYRVKINEFYNLIFTTAWFFFVFFLLKRLDLFCLRLSLIGNLKNESISRFPKIDFFENRVIPVSLLYGACIAGESESEMRNGLIAPNELIASNEFLEKRTH